ncbi:protein TBATA-like isoform X1 [Pomacea canaliculata]|uniref:protein TBATA-like isoform X1 n=1 Tax=Pomacea canaliculata TaxID=400727 RepID=UPI000D72756E|nr:protein TBATA-like isoform X1 [Pomacea canaliculata]
MCRMSTSEVFRPSNGELLVRDNIATGVDHSAEFFRKRPATQSGYRFGQLSHNSFFTRHNPHPMRVRHMKGLLDVPICTVNDDGYFANPRYSLQFPPNSFNNSKLQKWKGRIPVNAININSQLHPINTITGLQYFTGSNYPWRERAVPRVGLVPVTETWRDELLRFTQALTNGADLTVADVAAKDKKADDERPKTTVYSPETGRIIPPPSRALSRNGASRRAQRDRFLGNLQHIAAEPDMENMVLTMLCQILQTDDVNAIQAWLCSAGEREKSLVMDMIRAAVAGREEYWKQYPAEVIEQNDAQNKLPPINGATKPSSSHEVNRLVIDDGGSPAQQVNPLPQPPAVRQVIEDKDIGVKPQTSEVFRPPSPPKKLPQTAPPQQQNEEVKKSLSAQETRLKYTKSPIKDLAADLQSMWNPSQSVNTF